MGSIALRGKLQLWVGHPSSRSCLQRTSGNAEVSFENGILDATSNGGSATAAIWDENEYHTVFVQDGQARAQSTKWQSSPAARRIAAGEGGDEGAKRSGSGRKWCCIWSWVAVIVALMIGGGIAAGILLSERQHQKRSAAAASSMTSQGSTATSTSDGISPTATITTATTPSLVQTGVNARCQHFYRDMSGDTCIAIADQYGITAAQFEDWNTALGAHAST
ncbi:hypothetical protein LTS14_010342 [Recurvomyces mirabilis]|uniref:uncharacterized protein n=1 Tax=Recurvomyces mirabilis TaxID=574656 RepID=UPI002DDFCFA2|nr:hypothetical protein LTS14_010342 [Recurvomyces mirabilis]